MKVYNIYTDGSFWNKGSNPMVHGGIVFEKDGEIVKNLRFHVTSKNEMLTIMRNVGGEIAAAYMAIMIVVNSSKDNDEPAEINLAYDYEGVGKWLTGEWQTKKPGTIWYRKAVYDLLNAHPNIKLNLRWVRGHQNTRGNIEADACAEYTMSYAKAENLTIFDLDKFI